MNDETRSRLFASLDRATRVPLLILAVVMIPLLTLPEVIDLDPELVLAFDAASLAIWVFFAVELGLKLLLARDRAAYLRANWIDVITVALPMLRPVRVLTATVVFIRFMIELRELLLEHPLPFSVIGTVVVVAVCSGLMVVAEKGAGGTIQDASDALWWSVTTVTTVGYGDRYPVTPFGRAIAVFLMLAGIVLFSLLTASLSAMLVQRKESTTEDKLDQLLARVENLERKMDQG